MHKKLGGTPNIILREVGEEGILVPRALVVVVVAVVATPIIKMVALVPTVVVAVSVVNIMVDGMELAVVGEKAIINVALVAEVGTVVAFEENTSVKVV